MRRIYQLSMLCLAAGVVACSQETDFAAEDIPTAGVRFLNFVPDTGAVDFRAVDIVENSQFYAVGFRSTTLAFYKNAEAGSRHFKVFMSVGAFDRDLTAEQQIAIASTVLADTTFTLEAGHRYSFILWGFARAGQNPHLKLSIIDDNPADPGAQVALRLVNAAVGLGPIDGKQYLASGAPPGTATWGNVAEQTVSAYVATPTGSIKYNVTPAGGGAALFTDPTAIAGAAATIDLDPIPGTTVAGSAVSGFVVPRAVAGSKATQSFTTPGMIFLWDRRPPRPAGT